MAKIRTKKGNGRGSITKTKKNKPYWVRVTDSVTKKRVSLGLYKTKKEAQQKLDEYLFNPYNLETHTMTFEEIFNLFKEAQEKNVAKATFKSYINSYKRCKPLYNLIFRDIKTPQLQSLINDLNCSKGTKSITKGFLSVLYKYAIEMEILTINRAEHIKLPKESKHKEINIFTGYDIKKLWDNIKIDWVEYILIMIYTGMRIGEAVNLKKENVDLINGIIFGGNKTEKGMNRKIPIRDDIYPIIENLYKDSPTDYLFYNKNWVFKKKNNENKPIRENYFREKFYKTLETLGIEKHETHDCRKTLATFMRKYQLNEVQITDILGHESINTTIDYYIKKEDEQELKKSINRIDFFKDVV